MKFMFSLIVAMLIFLMTSPAHAQSEPTARRAYLLCQMEDPSCGPALQELYNAAIHNPTWEGIGQSLICPRLRPPGIRPRAGDYLAPLTLEDIYRVYMDSIRGYPAIGQYSGRIGMLYALQRIWHC